MKNILKNLSGGFFRTFGRVLFYIVLGALFGFFVKSNDIKISDLLGIGKVYASTLQSWSVQQGRVQLDDHGTESWTSWSNISGDNSLVFSQSDLPYPVKAISWRVRASNGLSKENSYTFRFNYKPTPDAIAVSTYYISNATTGEEEEFSCRVERYDSGYYWYNCSFTPTNSYSSSDYVYIKINFIASYLTELRIGIRGFEELKGTNAVITEQSTNIINNNNQNTNNIINNNNQNTQQIIDNQNANSQAQIDSQKVCSFYDKSNISYDNSYLTSSGTIASNNNLGVTEFLSIVNSEIKLLTTFTDSNYARTCFYNTNKSFISCVNINSSFQVNDLITIPSNASYVRFTINKSSNVPTFEICKHGNQALTDALTDDSSPDVSGLSDMAGWLPAGPLDSILNLPLTLLNALTTALSGTCSPITLTLPYISEDLTLPCISSIYESIGAITFVNWIGGIASAFILFKYLMKLYKWVDDTLTFRENNWLDNWGGVD